MEWITFWYSRLSDERVTEWPTRAKIGLELCQKFVHARVLLRKR
jgi:hypothetical protein